MRTLLLTLSAVLLSSLLGGCGALAFPCRATSAMIKIVPLVGHAAAIPTDACAAVIDP
ncbi:DUF6726 family protein [Azohydromonas caseinilytica]|uniref:Lipoprotein n=1 Tax=Azohydromonas caseinilytica TaxID=2728836 RepID=A0A848FEG5_9BURK|nr:DUF6726 family protein [Azohydromonas caseinilytica]NML18607.1 hypothetical protein [Azohydromonas caseinilytica]